MKVAITERQLKELVSGYIEQQIDEADDSPEAAEPKSGASDDQVGGSPPPPGGTEGGYPEVHKWESGVTRGPDNQIGNTKWVDAPNTQPKRDKANQLI